MRLRTSYVKLCYVQEESRVNVSRLRNFSLIHFFLLNGRNLAKRCIFIITSEADSKVGDCIQSEGGQGGGRDTGDGRRKGGRRDLYDGGKRERNSKSQAFFICYCLLPVKETKPTTFLDFHLTFSEA